MKRLERLRPPHALLAMLTLLLTGCGDDPQQILDEMGQAYRAADRYSDDARVTVRQTHGDSSTEQTYPYRVAFVRPDRIRVEAYDARVVTDGATLYAAVGTVPGQVLSEPVATPLTLDQIFADDALRSTLTEGEAGCPTQLPLLLADDTLALILAESDGPPRIVGTATVDGHDCIHLEITKPDGVLGLWIDRTSKLLRRMRVPTAAYADGLSREAGAPVGVAVEVEFTDASFEAEVPAEAFAFEVPAAAARVTRLEPLDRPQPLHPRIGTKAGLPPLTTIDGEPLTRESLGDATLVLDFFFEGCGPAARSLPQVAAGIADFVAGYARDHRGARPAVKHVAVSLDPEDQPLPAIRKTLAEFGGVGTLARDPQGVSPQALGLESFPVTVIVAGDGRIADVIVGDHSRIAADVAETLAAMERDTDTKPLVRARHERRLREYRRDLDRAAGSGQRLPEQVIAPRKQPVRFKLERAWRAADVALPGNVVCLDEAHGAAEPRIVALDGWRTIVELDAHGAERGRHELDLPADAGVGFLRTALGRDGGRWWLAGRRGGQHVFVFDDAWRLHATYPASGGAAHEGISDAGLGDLDGDGTPEIVVGYVGTAGVEAVTLAGHQLWHRRLATPVVGVAIGAPVAGATAREVLAVTGNGRIVRVAAEPATEATPTPTSEAPIVAVASGPVADAGGWAILGIASQSIGRQLAAGIDPSTLARSWQVPLGDGVHRDGPIEPLAWADLLGTQRRQWLIAAPDGSVTVAWADGRVVDRYQHGKPLVGIGGYRQGDRGHVVLATREGLEAFTMADVALD
jgi:outer membrane lipoprotein-sorting protein